MSFSPAPEDGTKGGGSRATIHQVDQPKMIRRRGAARTASIASRHEVIRILLWWSFIRAELLFLRFDSSPPC